jgi:hypothetical protein
MKSPYGLNIFDNCATCPVREQHIFCNLPHPRCRGLNDITSPGSTPAALCGSLKARRVVEHLCFAPEKQSCPPLREGARPSLPRFPNRETCWGLNATISNRPYEVTAEMVMPGQANFIAADDLLQFLHDYAEVALRVAQLLTATTIPPMRKSAFWD